MPYPTPALDAAAALVGLVFGSFLNVCIVRLPRHESIVRPRSHCTGCGTLIRWYDNIPLISYALLGGRCRSCRHRISPHYPIVELLSAGLWVAVVNEFGLSLASVKWVLFGMVMVILIFTDFRDRLLPHSVTITGIALGLVFSLFVPVNDFLLEWVVGRLGLSAESRLVSLAAAVAGGIFGGGLLYVVAKGFERFGDPEKEYLGFGDVMIMLLAGVFLGIPRTYVAILAGSLLGSLIAVPLTLAGRRFRSYPWPFGSFLGIGSILAGFQGQALLEGYLRWSGFK